MSELNEAASHLLEALESIVQRIEVRRDERDTLYSRFKMRPEPAPGCIRKGYDLLKQARTSLENCELREGIGRIVDGSLAALTRAINDLEPLRIAAEWYDDSKDATFLRFPHSGPEYEFLGIDHAFAFPMGSWGSYDSRVQRLAFAAGHWMKKHEDELRFRSAGLEQAANAAVLTIAKAEFVGIVSKRLNCNRSIAGNRVNRAIKNGTLEKLSGGSLTCESAKNFLSSLPSVQFRSPIDQTDIEEDDFQIGFTP